MKKLKKIIVCLLPIIMLMVSVINVYAYSISVNDFAPVDKTEKEKGHFKHTSIGTWNDGKFFETVTQDTVSYDKESGTKKIRIRYYITHRGGKDSYIYQKVPVGVKVDGTYVTTFKSWQGIDNKIKNKTQKCGETTISLKPGKHTVELYDATGGAITVVNVKFTFNVPFVVDFFNWDGTLLDRQQVMKGQDAVPPKAPERTGYTFDKWDKSYTNITSNKDITAIYKINKYTVTWKDYNGKTLKEEIVNYGSNASPPPNPSRPGYTFTGWDKGYTNITSNRVITAQYNINKYNVTWKDYNGNVLKSETVNHGSNASPPASPSRPGYTFTGWDSTYTNITSNRVITATYSINYYGATTSHWVSKDTTPGAWNPPGNTNANGSMILYTQSDKQSLPYGSMYYPKPVNIEGYELSSNDFSYNAPGGWTSKPNGTGVQVLQYVGAEYYYKKKEYTVTFVTNGGTDVTPQKVLYKNKATYPKPTKRNFKFVGWYTDSALRNEVDPNTPITRNTTVYAKWERTHYDISFSHRTYDVVNGWKTIRNESRQLPIDSILPVDNLSANDIPIGYQPENKYDLYKDGNKVGNSYPFSTKQSVNGSFDTVVIRYNAIPAKIKAKETYYFQNENIKSNDLVKRAEASDIKDGNISSSIFVDKIKYPDKTVNRPDKLETDKCQDVIVTFGVTNSRGVTSYANANFHVIRRGSDLEVDTDDAKIYSRFISNQTLVDGSTPLSKLPTNSVWRKPEFAEVLHTSLANNTPLAEYAYINKPGVESYMKSVKPGEDANRNFVSRFK